VTIRSTSFARGLGAGYLATAINIAYTAASVPLALHYLGKDQFGLWSLSQQIVGYLILLDLGVTSAVSRFIADHKDDVNGGDYGRLLLTGAIVFAIQGALIVIVGLVFSIFAPALFSVPTPLASDFTKVLMIISSLAGISIFSRSLSAPLWAFHRIDFSYVMGTVSLLLGFAALWLGFHFGWGIYSFAISGLPAALLCPAMTFYFCRRNGFYPSAKSGWQAPALPDILRVFAFGKDAALMTLGSQMVNATQIMIISRFVGLDAAAIFSIGTKLYSLGQQLVARVVGTAAPALTELFVRGENARFNTRFYDVVSISIFLATMISSFLVIGNSAVVSIWTSRMISWNPLADVLLGALLVGTSVSRCLNELFVYKGNLKTVRHIYFVEGLFSITLSIPAVIRFGLIGLLATTLFVHLAVALSFSLKAAARAFVQAVPIMRLILKSFLILFLMFVCAGLSTRLHLERTQAILFIILFAPVGGFLGWSLLLHRSLRTEISHRFTLSKYFP
jgi:O-antigen/teichoic acid export membrane protein